MLTSLGFDTVIINNGDYDSQSLAFLFELLSKSDIKNFVFASDFDLSQNSFSLENQKINNFKAYLKNISFRGIHNKVFYNLIFSQGATFNDEFKRLYAVKKYNSLFITLPIFTDTFYESLAADINHMIYRHKAFPVILNFDKILDTASEDFCDMLINTSHIGFGLDVNYIFDPAKLRYIDKLLCKGSMIIPTICHHMSNYVGIMNEAESFMENIGKRKYYQLCAQIRRCAAKFNC